MASSDRNSWKTLRNFDRRIVERNIRRGSVTRKQYDEYLAALPDAATNIAPPEPYEAPAPRRAAPVPSVAPVVDSLPGTPVSPEALAAGGGLFAGGFSNGHDGNVDAGYTGGLDDGDDEDEDLEDEDEDEDEELPPGA